jgi:hypothetical protein
MTRFRPLSKTSVRFPLLLCMGAVLMLGIVIFSNNSAQAYPSLSPQLQSGQTPTTTTTAQPTSTPQPRRRPQHRLIFRGVRRRS